MWFDPKAKLAEIAAQRPTAHAPSVRAVSQMSRVSQAPELENATFRVATPPRPKPETARTNRADTETFPHGLAVGGRPKTWTGRVVLLEDWRHLTKWEKHGQKGRHWNGVTRQWEKPKGGAK